MMKKTYDWHGLWHYWAAHIALPPSTDKAKHCAGYINNKHSRWCSTHAEYRHTIWMDGIGKHSWNYPCDWALGQNCQCSRSKRNTICTNFLLFLFFFLGHNQSFLHFRHALNFSFIISLFRITTDAKQLHESVLFFFWFVLVLFDRRKRAINELCYDFNSFLFR